MTALKQIEDEIVKLPREDFFRLHGWIRDRFQDMWDTQTEEDSRSGRLDSITRKALAEHRSGQSSPFPSDE